MTLEKRMDALDARFAAMTTQRNAIRDELIALRAVVTAVLPIISASVGARLFAALGDAEKRATDALLAAGYDSADIHEVLDALAALREDMGVSDAPKPGAVCH